MKLLRDELVSNAVAFSSELGDILTGHLLLMVLEDKYTDATTELKPTAPTDPTEPVPVSSRTPTRANPINYDDTKEEFRAYTASKSKYS